MTTDTPTGNAELIKRLRDGIDPPDGAFDPEPPTWARDPFNDDCAEQCGRCGAWSEVVRPGKTQCGYCWDDDTRVLRLAAADALEVAERVIAPFATLCTDITNLAARYDGELSDPHNWSKSCTWDELVAARDWLARHATTQRQGGSE